MTAQSRSEDSGLSPGLQGEASVVVTEDQTAVAVGSGTIAVFATPSLAALMERAAVACVENHLAPGEASLGVHLALDHTAASLPGQSVSAHATLTAIDGRRLTFAIEAQDDAKPIGKATHIRVVVDAARFLSKISRETS
ncbi:thioesterase family protein [Hyphomicrobium sp.]|uniref:thioesterase family protein n=1 Tax=Hyphomicrobium sp. TaxID=82 RepID=UPI0025BAD831|nr:thioesterase family protein [Hyphomicrobium sp.]MCC7253927.1 thioesterase family protein [Hyphomicrobium sp.]